jgi:hypothetical protein
MMTNTARAALIAEFVGLYFDRGINERTDELGSLGLRVINARGSNAAIDAEFARAARRAAAAEGNADLARAAEIAEALAA